jgi:hypothetical protein
MIKVFLLLFVSLCFGFVGLVLWAGPAHAQPPGCAVVANQLGMCEDNLAACEAQPPAAVPQTGQTTSYAAGDDGDVQAGVVPPVPRFMDNEDGTITDNLTGLIWLKNANCFGIKTWAQALTDANTLNSGDCGLTDGSAEGDWYLPNRNQLTSLLDLGNFDPALPTGHPFVNFQSRYWSSTTLVSSTNFAWSVDFVIGLVDFLGKTTSLPVLPVRGGS